MGFYQNFKKICEKRGVSEYTVVRKCGLEGNKILRYRKGSLPKEDYLLRFAKELNCTVSDFFIDTDEYKLYEELLNEDEKDILRIFNLMDRQQQHIFMAELYEKYGN